MLLFTLAGSGGGGGASMSYGHILTFLGQFLVIGMYSANNILFLVDPKRPS